MLYFFKFLLYKKAKQNNIELPYTFSTGDELLELCSRENLSISQIMMRNECVWRSEEEVKERYNNILDEREVVLVYSVISNDIYLTGIAEPKIGNKQYMYDFQIITTIKGLGGKQQSKRSVTIILKQDGVINNRYGIAIDSIAIN